MRDRSVQPALFRDSHCSTMSLDKQKAATPAKPFTPTLSTANRSQKTPLTPKLVASKNTSPISPPRRGLRTEPTVSATSRREDFRSPITPQLGGNITPRSGARVSRIGGDSPSTSAGSNAGTPSRARPLSAIELAKPRRYLGTTAGSTTIDGLGAKQSSAHVTPHVVTGRVSSSDVGRRVSTGSSRNGAANPVSPRLSHVNNAHTSSQSEVGDMARTKKPATFFYANEAVRKTNSPEPLQNPESALEQEGQGKFCYANGRPTEQPSIAQSPVLAVKRIPPAISTTPIYQSSAQGILDVVQQPSSPIKAASLRSAPATFSAASGTSIRSKMTDSSTKPKTPVTPSDPSRRASTSSRTSTVRETAQLKPTTPVSTPSTPSKRAKLQISPRAYKSEDVSHQPAIPHSPTERFSPRSTSLSSSNTGVSSQTLDSTPSNSAHSLSPAKSVAPSSPLQRTNELAANARRERKVLDLEISNSSLLAINRSLEREMRKQSLELRRFKRLSRSRQISMASTSMRSVSGQSGLSTLPESEDGDGYDTYGNLSELDGEMSNSEFEGSDLDNSFDDDSSLLSSTSYNMQQSKRRARDEKRLMLDLSKHQQQLIDSQKMNQSIKRCLNWTEELIIEGRKALEYQVKVSDVAVGGIVLTPDPDDDDDDDDDNGEGAGTRSKGLLSSSHHPLSTPNEVKLEKTLWRRGLEEMELELDRMLASSSTLKEVMPA
jgi:hypothetical protein